MSDCAYIQISGKIILYKNIRCLKILMCFNKQAMIVVQFSLYIRMTQVHRFVVKINSACTHFCKIRDNKFNLFMKGCISIVDSLYVCKYTLTIWSTKLPNIFVVSAFSLDSVLNPVLLLSHEMFSLKSMEALHVGEIHGVWREMRIANVILKHHKKHTYSKI